MDGITDWEVHNFQIINDRKLYTSIERTKRMRKSLSALISNKLFFDELNARESMNLHLYVSM